jgi:hypothetical protein
MRKHAPVSTRTSIAEVLERVLDRGLVIDAWVQVSVAGLKLIDVDARVVVASISGYVRYAQAVATVPAVSRPQLAGPPARPALVAGTRTLPRAPRRGRRTGAKMPLRIGRCEHGCTFLERFRSPAPVSVRCPYASGQRCDVEPA